MDAAAAAGMQNAQMQTSVQQAAIQNEQRHEAQLTQMVSESTNSAEQNLQSGGEQDTSTVPSTAEAEGRGTQVDTTV